MYGFNIGADEFNDKKCMYWMYFSYTVLIKPSLDVFSSYIVNKAWFVWLPVPRPNSTNEYKELHFTVASKFNYR